VKNSYYGTNPPTFELYLSKSNESLRLSIIIMDNPPQEVFNEIH